MSVTVVRRRFSADEYRCMIDAGILTRDDHVELIDGEIVEMSPIGNRHGACVDALSAALWPMAQGRAQVRVQGHVRVDPRSEPQPDIAVLRPRPDRYARSAPGPEDILLLVEVADSSLAYDRLRKIPLYAAAGVPEVWLVDLTNDRVEVHREPGPQGYGSVRTFARGERLAVPFAPGEGLAPEAFLPEG